MPNTAISALKKAVEGLLYTSETDEPLHTCSWKGGGGSPHRREAARTHWSDPSDKVEEASLDDFFSTQTEGYEGQGDEEKDKARKFKDLLDAIKAHLSHIKAFRVGDVNVRYYVVGETKQGEWAGIWTNRRCRDIALGRRGGPTADPVGVPDSFAFPAARQTDYHPEKPA